MTFGDLLDERARAQPDAEAVIFRDQRLTYGALRAGADDLARALLAVGVRKGDRVAEARDQARVICFLASADADFVTGVTIDVTGGV